MLNTSTTGVIPLPPVKASPIGWGAAAVATVGRVTVEVDEAMVTHEWRLSTEAPNIYISLLIDGPEVIARLHGFLNAHDAGGANEVFFLACHGSQNVEILRDNEPEPRFFIVLKACQDSSVRLTMADEQLRHWVEALADVCDQLRG